MYYFNTSTANLKLLSGVASCPNFIVVFWNTDIVTMPIFQILRTMIFSTLACNNLANK